MLLRTSTVYGVGGLERGVGSGKHWTGKGGAALQSGVGTGSHRYGKQKS